MRERKETISLVKANVWSIALLIIGAACCLGWYLLVRGPEGAVADLKPGGGIDSWWAPTAGLLLMMVVIILGAVVHELVHGITWAHYASSGWKSISFGVIWKMLTPYCHCNEPLEVAYYRRGALMPLFVVGILPGLLAPFFHSIGMALFGALYIAGAAGDLMVVWRLRKENPANTVLDHPTEAGYLVYEEEKET